MHSQGRGTPAHFGVTSEVDFIMGTFSKALASIGGFIASDDEDALEYLKHQSRTLIFSAALPVSNARRRIGKP
jgi:glycine C-acetyltransferase